jgi:hypothetical protein
MPPNNPMTPQRMLEIADFIHTLIGHASCEVELRAHAEWLERNVEREGKYGEYCIRNSGHDGPCNGLPRKDCLLPKPPEAK